MPQTDDPNEDKKPDMTGKVENFGRAVEAVKRVVVSTLLAVAMVAGLMVGLVFEISALRKAILQEFFPATASAATLPPSVAAKKTDLAAGSVAAEDEAGE
jgi:hypothetical protein